MATKPRKSLVVPERPEGFICHRAGDENLPPELVAKEIPEEAQFLAGVFWSWSPAHCLVDRFFLSSNEQDNHWLLWLQWANADWEWKTELYAFGPKRDVPPETAALYLLVDAFSYDRQKERLTTAFHEIDEEGLLKLPHLRAIARIAWPDDERYQEPEPEIVPVPKAKTTQGNGGPIRKGTGFYARELSPTDPVYTSGFQVGGWITKDSFPNTKRWEDMTAAERDASAAQTKQKILAEISKGMQESVPRQFGMGTSPSTTGSTGESSNDDE
ncbi:hypothetical protein [Desulfoferula mesophila]|uniref:Uncharacterized protein n=1 Tax=Desulfoferula mesophila TaxID=3058419 RepID=A0AAU9ETJ2_9BACT|nr:hypothetical protein FAK_02040 [Desulfoferula mesophilus]